MVNKKITTIENIKEKTKSFLENNGDGSCDYCNGANLPTASDNPLKAVLSLKVNNKTHYSLYIAVQDELTKAYYELRESYAKQKFGKTSEDLSKEEIKILREVYPFILSEAETK